MCRDRRKETARMAIERKFPEIILPKESEGVDNAMLLRYYLTANDEGNFLKTLETVEDLDALGNKTELLRLAVEHNLQNTTKLLLQRDTPDSLNLSLLAKTTVERGHPEILKELLSRSPKLADRLLMPASQELGVPSRPGPRNRNNRLECLKLILNQDGVDVRQEDGKNIRKQKIKIW